MSTIDNILAPSGSKKYKLATTTTHRKVASDSIKANMNLMNEVCGVANTHKGTPLIDIILPSIDLFIILEREPILLILCLQE